MEWGVGLGGILVTGPEMGLRFWAVAVHKAFLMRVWFMPERIVA